MKFLRVLGSEVALGTLVVILSIMTALASYQGSLSNSAQNTYEVSGITTGNAANVAYLTANQLLIYDITMYNGWNTADNEDEAAYYQSGYSVELQDSIAKDPYNPFSEEYYDAKYSSAFEMYGDADSSFEVASQWDNRGDKLQLVMLLMALGLALAAWASLLAVGNNLRVVFALLAIVTLVWGLITYISVPVVG